MIIVSKQQVSKETLKYMTDGIRYVCENFKKRAPGTQSERDAQAYLKGELSKYSDSVIMEDFDLHPAAFMGFIPVAAIFGMFAILFYWLSDKFTAGVYIGEFLILMSVLMFIFEFLMYRPFVDIFFPKKVSRNVFATRKPSGEVKRRIIFGGHTDAANEWTFSYHGQLKTLAPVMGGAIGGMFFIFIVNTIFTIKTLAAGAAPELIGAWKVLGIIELCLIPFLIAILFFINWPLVVDGANDNLTACYISMAVLKDMAEADKRFENTEVCCLLTGSEEAGLRGAQAFAKKHKKEFTDIETVFISMDTMREVEQLQVYTKGCTGTVQASESVGDLIHEAGKNCGIEMPRAELYPGAVDSDGFAQNGLTAAGFCGVNHNPKTYYHTRLDTADNISPECIELSLKICKECAELYDANGGIAKYQAPYTGKKR